MGEWDELYDKWGGKRPRKKSPVLIIIIVFLIIGSFTVLIYYTQQSKQECGLVDGICPKNCSPNDDLDCIQDFITTTILNITSTTRVITTSKTTSTTSSTTSTMLYICGDGICDIGENENNCCKDCGCKESQACDMGINECVNGISYSNVNVRLECPYCTGEELEEYCENETGECETSLYNAYTIITNIFVDNVDLFGSDTKKQLVFEISPEETTFRNSTGVAGLFYPSDYGGWTGKYSITIITNNFPALRHEITHWFEEYLFHPKELWFNEGLAMYSEGLYTGDIWYGINCYPPVGCKCIEYYSLLKEGQDIFEMRPFLKDAHYTGGLFFIGLIEDYNCDYDCIKELVNYIVVKYNENENFIDKMDIKEGSEIATSQNLEWLFDSLSPGIEYNKYYSPMPDPSTNRTC